MEIEDYVSIEVAKLLQEKGFDEPCDRMYNEKDESFEYSCYTLTKEGFRNSFLCDCEVAVPSLYEAQKWLRRKYNTYISAIPLDDNRPKNKRFTFTIDKLDENNEWDWGWEREPCNYYASYEEALDNGILEALKLI